MKVCWKNAKRKRKQKQKKDAAEASAISDRRGPPSKRIDPLSQKIWEMVPQQFAPLLYPYDDDGQLGPPIFSKHK